MTKTDSLIFVVDDDASVRKSLTRLLRSAGWKVEALASAQEFLARPAYGGSSCVVLDVRMPGMNGPELRDQLLARKISSPIVFLTGHGDIPTSVDAMKKGAVDFLQKPVDDKQLLRTIDLAIERHRQTSARAREVEQIHERIARLSDRECEVMEYIIGGCLNKQIGDALGIAEKTVKVHRGRVMEKMKVISVAELVHLCEVAGIVPRKHARR